MSTISASTTSTTAYKVTADTTGTLVLQTGATPTTAVTISSAQAVTLANALNLSSSGLTFSNSSTQTIGAGMGTGGQTWQSVTGSRAIGTTYTKSTGYPIFVVISGTGGGANGLWGVTLSGAITFYTPSTYTTGVWTSTAFVVPNGGTYALSQQGSSATLQNWSELR